MNIPNRERRDWGLIIFIIPIGILLIFIVGQLAVGIFPNWRINADMRSNLDPNSVPGQPASLLQPLLQQILTPMAWAQSYLTPGADISYPPFFVFEPSATSSTSPTSVSPTPTTPSPTTPVPTGSVTSTSKPPTDKTPTPTSTTTTPTTCQDINATNYGGPLPCTYVTPPTTCEDPLATNNGGPLPCVYPPPTCEDPLATNNGGPLPCVYPPTTCEDPDATNQGDPLPCIYGYPTTIPTGYTQIDPPPSQIGTPGPPDNSLASIYEGTYIVLNFSIEVGATPDANYDLVFYEFNNGGNVLLDWIIIGISNSADGSSYYEVFNWGNAGTPVPDTNTNVGDIAGGEADEQLIDSDELYDPDGTVLPDPDPNPNNNTGILIDVDNATSEPPPGTYNYIVVISPIDPLPDNSTEVDSIDVIEVPITP